METVQLMNSLYSGFLLLGNPHIASGEVQSDFGRVLNSIAPKKSTVVRINTIINNAVTKPCVLSLVLVASRTSLILSAMLFPCYYFIDRA